jgi:hypothetical protein
MKVKFDAMMFYIKDIQLLKKNYTENFNLKVIEEDEIWVLPNGGNVNIAFHKNRRKIF